MTYADRDPGLQAERTALAHVRTWFGVVAVALLLARRVVHGDLWTVFVAAGAVAAAGIATALRIRRLAAGHVAQPRRTMVTMVAAVAALQVAAILVTF